MIRKNYDFVRERGKCETSRSRLDTVLFVHHSNAYTQKRDLFHSSFVNIWIQLQIFFFSVQKLFHQLLIKNQKKIMIFTWLDRNICIFWFSWRQIANAKRSACRQVIFCCCLLNQTIFFFGNYIFIKQLMSLLKQHVSFVRKY